MRYRVMAEKPPKNGHLARMLRSNMSENPMDNAESKKRIILFYYM